MGELAAGELTEADSRSGAAGEGRAPMPHHDGKKWRNEEKKAVLGFEVIPYQLDEKRAT